MSVPYAELYKAVKPYVSWSLGRRTRFTGAEKGKITRAAAALASMRRAGLTPRRIRRSPGESPTAHRRRVAAIKALHGESGSPLAAIGLRVAASERVRIKGTRVRVISTTTGRRQWFIPFDPFALVGDEGTRRAHVRSRWDAAVAGGATRVQIAFGGGRRVSLAYGAVSDPDDLEDLVEEIVDRGYDDITEVLRGIYAESGGGIKR